MRARAHGFLLLPVTLTLVLVGALAYTMTRDAGMNVAAVDADYDTEAARYLAEAAFNLARWKNSHLACKGVSLFTPTQLYRYNLASERVGTTPADLVGTMTVNPGGVIEVKGNGDKEKAWITVDVRSSTARDAAGSHRIVRTVPRFDFDAASLVTTRITSGAATTLHTGAPPADTVRYMELTDNGPGNQSYGLLRFDLARVPDKALVTKASIELERDGGESSQIALRKLELHRVTRAWDPATATWNSPSWSAPGGDHVAAGVVSSHLRADGTYTSYVEGNGIYAWRIDTLAAGCADLHNLRWYQVEATIFPDSAQGGPMTHWDLDDLRLVPANATPPSPLTDDEGDDEFELHELVLIDEGAPVIPVDGKVTGPRRLRFVVGVPPAVPEVQFRYYFEQFGRVVLAGPTALPPPR